MQTFKNEQSQHFSQPLIGDSLQSYGGVQAEREHRESGIQFGASVHTQNQSFITSQRPEGVPRLQFIPVSLTVMATLVLTIVLIMYVQAQLWLPFTFRAHDPVIRIVFIPFLLFVWLSIAAYILDTTATLHLHNAFLKNHLRHYSGAPSRLHLILFPCVSAFFICSQPLLTLFFPTLLETAGRFFPAEPTCVTLWSLAHFIDLYIFLRLLWSCITHNYLRDHSHLFNIDPGQLGFIREQRWITSGVSELLMLKTEQLRRLIENPRFPSRKEQDLETSLSFQEDKLEPLQEKHLFLEVQVQGLRATVANKHTECTKKERSLQIHQTIEKHNSSLLARLDRQRAILENENQKKSLLLQISRKQLESSRNLHDVIAGRPS